MKKNKYTFNLTLLCITLIILLINNEKVFARSKVFTLEEPVLQSSLIFKDKTKRKVNKNPIYDRVKIGDPYKKFYKEHNKKREYYEASLTLNSDLYVINNELRKSNVRPININDNILIPLRTIIELFEIEPIFNDKDKTIFLVMEDFSLLLSLDTGKIAMINNSKDVKVLDSLILKYEGQNFIPLNAIKEFGISTSWNKKTNKISLYYRNKKINE